MSHYGPLDVSDATGRKRPCPGCPILGTRDNVPRMGQKRSYHEAVNWDPRLTRAERERRAPFQAAFGVGHADTAMDAIVSAQREASIAVSVLDQVREQAVFALLDEGMDIRSAADRLGMTKSAVGRIAKSLRGKDGVLESRVVTAAGVGSGDEVRQRVQAAWGHS